jgi:hypothetical protein
LVSGTNGSSGDTVPLRIIPERAEVVQDNPKTEGAESGAVFSDDIPGSNLPDESGEVAPKAGSLAGDADSLAADGNVLTGESAAENSDSWWGDEA